MRLGEDGGDLLELGIAGYQFPDASDPEVRSSWHLVQGRATTAVESWELRWPALTCDESTRLPAWLLRVADAVDRAAAGREPDLPESERFTEPDLAFALVSASREGGALRVDLDLELRAPGNRTHPRAGRPSTLLLRTSSAQLRRAASDWGDDVARYPDLSTSGGSTRGDPGADEPAEGGS